MKRRVLAVVVSSLLTIWALPNPLGAQAGQAAGGRTSATVQRVAGCYQLTTGAWSGPLPSTGLPGAHRPLARFALDTARLAPPFDARYAVHPASLGSRTRMPASWVLVGADSASVVWSTGYVSVALHVQVRGDSLVGVARPFHDAHVAGEPSVPEARAVAVRVSCAPESRPAAG